MKRLLPCLLLAAMLPLSAQFSLSGKDRGDKPILINSDSMDVDMENGKATFYGNVIVNDQDVTITCQKMVLYQEPKADRKKDKNSCVLLFHRSFQHPRRGFQFQEKRPKDHSDPI